MLRIERSAWVLVVSSALIQIVIFPLLNLYVLSWVAVAPLLIALVRAQPPKTLQLEGRRQLLPASPAQAFLLAYGCGCLWYAGSCYWVYNTMKQYGGISPAGAAGLLILFCLYLALYHGLFGVILGLVAKSSVRAALVLSPVVWVAVELARTRVSGFPWDLLGITQVDNVPLARIARVTGVYGVSFEIMVVNAAFAAAFVARQSRRRSMLMAALMAAFVLESARWVPLPAIPADHSALLVQENIPVLESNDWTASYFETTLADLSRISQSVPPAEHRHPDLVVWPESPAPFYNENPLFRTGLTQIARSAQAWIVVGMITTEKKEGKSGNPTLFNSAGLVSPKGEWKGRYDKVHLVPFGEYVPWKNLLGFAGGLTQEVGDFSAGSARHPLEAGDEKLGTFICYESIFPDEIRQFANQGAQVFVNISNDGWYGDSGAYAQHLRQARMRALEDDRWLLRATNTGVTADIDPFGRVVAKVPRKVRTVLPAPYSLNLETTFYTRHGDWLAYACAIITMGAMLVAITPAKARSIA
ncbi:MAG: apolipoprotein N-acyltransferase [Acidobacteria bacterium]|nr:apolipoprotein N-acyltransferase [Acidobacteriota bacterium]